MVPALATAAGFLVVAVIVALTARRSARADPARGARVLRYSWFIKLVGIFAVGLGAIMLCIALFTEAPVGVDFGGALLLLLGCVLIAESFGTRVVFDQRGIAYHCLTRAAMSFKWDEVAEVRFASANPNAPLQVTANDGRSFRIQVQFMEGTAELSQTLETVLEPSKLRPTPPPPISRLFGVAESPKVSEPDGPRVQAEPLGNGKKKCGACGSVVRQYAVRCKACGGVFVDAI